MDKFISCTSYPSNAFDNIIYSNYKVLYLCYKNPKKDILNREVGKKKIHHPETSTWVWPFTFSSEIFKIVLGKINLQRISPIKPFTLLRLNVKPERGEKL